MSVEKVVSNAQIGYQVGYDATKDKLIVNIDNNTIVSSATGVLSVDASKLGIKVVSDDAGNVLTVGTDTGAMLSKDDIKSVVGEMVAGTADGLDYDAVTKALTAYLASFATADTSTVALSFTDDANSDGTTGDAKLSADVKVSATADNAITVKTDGLYVKDKDVANNSSLNLSDSANPLLDIKIGSDSKTFALEELQDLAGNHLGYIIK